MKRQVIGLARASHFGPTLLVTSISYFFALLYWWEGPAMVIALGFFLGQLVVGWSNDLIDFQDDSTHQRMNKPLVSQLITHKQLSMALRIVLPLAILVNLFGPLGPVGGGLSLFAIAWAVAYNFYFKFTLLSWLPYAVAFAALPSCMALSKGYLPPLWMWLGGALFGVAAHFLNVIKDMKQDHMSGIMGLPQRCGTKRSALVAIALITAAIALLLLSDLSLPPVAP
jgi:4-hydroxybenzoate polyprenyltransferase